MLNEATIAEFRRISKIHEDWLIRTIIGPDLLTPKELEDIQAYNDLPDSAPIDLTTVSYLLGKKASHLKDSEYKRLGYTDLTNELSDLELASLIDLRLRAAVEVRNIAQHVSTSTQARLQSCLTKGIQFAFEEGNVEKHLQHQLDLMTDEVFSKAFTLFQNIYSLAVLDLVHISKNQAQLNCMIQAEGIYTEGLDSQIMIEHDGDLVPLTARHLMSKSLSGITLHYIPPGAVYSDGRIRIIDQDKFSESLSKAVSGVSGGISSTVKPAGPPQPKGVKNPGSIPGVAAPGNDPGPGRGNTVNAPKKGVEYDDWRGSGEPKPAGEGWEQSTTGGWRHIKGAGSQVKGPVSSEDEAQKTQQRQQDAVQYGRTPHPDSEVLGHLSEGTLVSIKRLSENESGIHNAFRVTTESGGRALMKPVEMHSAETHGHLAGTGYGSVPRNNSHGHEIGAYKLHTMLGLKSVNPTTSRSFDGSTHSIQAWAEDHVTGELHTLQAENLEEKNKTKLLLSMVPVEKRDEFKKGLMGMITMDVIMNNNDRHRDNLLIKHDSTDFKSIDHSDCFGTGMKGIRNDFHHDFHRMGTKVTIPEELQTSLRGKSYGDYKRALGGHLQDWQVGQTYLRSQYVLHLQDTEGHLDYHKFLPTMDGFHGGNEYPMLAVRKAEDGQEHFTVAKAWRVNNSSSDEEFNRRKEAKTLPNDLFESFAKKWINDHKNNPESSYYVPAKELSELGVFMPGTSIADPKAFRREGKHRNYENTIEARNPPTEVGHTKTLGLKDSGLGGTIRDAVNRGKKTVQVRNQTKA